MILPEQSDIYGAHRERRHSRECPLAPRAAAVVPSFLLPVVQRKRREIRARTSAKGYILVGSLILCKTQLQSCMAPGSRNDRAREAEEMLIERSPDLQGLLVAHLTNQFTPP